MQKSKDPGLKRSLKGHNDTVCALDFSPDSSQLVSASWDATLLIWKLNGKQAPYKFIGHTGAVYSIAFNPTGTLIATGSSDNTVRLWQNDSRGVSTTLKSHSGPVRSCSFSFDGQYLLTGSDDKYLKIFTVNNRKHSSTIAAHSNWIRGAEFSSDSRLIVSWSEDKTVKLWDSEQLTPIVCFEDDMPVLSARFHPDGTCLASGSADGKVQVWDIRSQLMLQMYTDAHSDAINSVAFHNSGRYLVTASSDATLKIFDLRKGTLMYSLYGHEGTVNAANFSHDGTLFASGGSDCNVILWDSNLIDPEQETEISKLKKAKKDSKNVDGKSRVGALTAAEKLRRIQKKRKLENKAESKENDNKENNPHANNEGNKYAALSETLAWMMDKIAAHLDIITRTVVCLERRIGDGEELVDQAYHAYKVHQKQSQLKADRVREQESQVLQDKQRIQEETKLQKIDETLEGTQEIEPLEDFGTMRDKARNIMSIINISQYSLAAVQKSANEIKDTTKQLKEDIAKTPETKNLRSTIKEEESEDDLERA